MLEKQLEAERPKPKVPLQQMLPALYPVQPVQPVQPVEPIVPATPKAPLDPALVQMQINKVAL